eukprot:jgi/Ulvmu1/2084/UM123_0016.1
MCVACQTCPAFWTCLNTCVKLQQRHANASGGQHSDPLAFPLTYVACMKISSYMHMLLGIVGQEDKGLGGLMNSRPTVISSYHPYAVPMATVARQCGVTRR